jgi:hypothetical protein
VRGGEHRHRDLWVALAVTLLTVGLGSALTVWSVEADKPHVGFWPHTWEIAGIAAVLLGIFLVLAVLQGWWLPGGFKEASVTRARLDLDAHRAALAVRAETLSRELYDFVAERKRDDAARGLRKWWGPGVSEEEKQRRFNEGVDDDYRFTAETMSRYGQRFAVRALTLFDDADEVGLAEMEDRRLFVNPVNPLGIEQIAQRVGVIGHTKGRVSRSTDSGHAAM